MADSRPPLPLFYYIKFANFVSLSRYGKCLRKFNTGLMVYSIKIFDELLGESPPFDVQVDHFQLLFKALITVTFYEPSCYRDRDRVTPA